MTPERLRELAEEADAVARDAFWAFCRVLDEIDFWADAEDGVHASRSRSLSRGADALRDAQGGAPASTDAAAALADVASAEDPQAAWDLSRPRVVASVGAAVGLAQLALSEARRLRVDISEGDDLREAVDAWLRICRELEIDPAELRPAADAVAEASRASRAASKAAPPPPEPPPLPQPARRPHARLRGDLAADGFRRVARSEAAEAHKSRLGGCLALALAVGVFLAILLLAFFRVF